MEHKESQETTKLGSSLVLPLNVISRVDISRMAREVVLLDEFLVSAAVRESGTNVKLPKTSRLMDELFESNKLNPLIKPDRKHLLQMLELAKKEAPQLHLSFSSNPPQLFLQRLIGWLRKEIHPQVMLKIGLQPGMGAGVIVRTSNKYFDFSLRERFSASRDVLLNRIRHVSNSQNANDSTEVSFNLSGNAQESQSPEEGASSV